jgi:hypothetical protein
MSKTGKLLITLVLCLLLFSGTGAAAGLNAVISNFKLFVNGDQVNQAVVVIDGRSYLPVRAIGEALGAEVDFNAETGRIDVNTDVNTKVDEPEEPTPPSTKNSRTNPAKLGDTVTLGPKDLLRGKATIELTLIELISGDAAWNKIRQFNRFNDEPEPGMEYVLAKFRVKVLSTEEDNPFSINHARFGCVSGTGTAYNEYFSLVMDPDLRTDIYQGGTHEGYTYFMVNKGDNAVAVFDKGFDSEAWFSLRP